VQMCSKVYQFVDTFSKCPSDLFHIGERDVFLRAFDHADICSVYLRKLSKTFLGVAFPFAFFTYLFAELDEDVFVHTYTKSVGSC